MSDCTASIIKGWCLGYKLIRIAQPFCPVILSLVHVKLSIVPNTNFRDI